MSSSCSILCRPSSGWRMSEELAGVQTRPIADIDDAIAAGVIFALYGETQQFEQLVPDGKAYRAIAIAEDKSLAVFDAYDCTDWEAAGSPPIARVVITRSRSASRATPNPPPDPRTSVIPEPPISFEMLSDGVMPRPPASDRVPRPYVPQRSRTPNPPPDPWTSVIPSPPFSFEMWSGPMPKPPPSTRVPRRPLDPRTQIAPVPPLSFDTIFEGVRPKPIHREPVPEKQSPDTSEPADPA